MTTQIVNAAPMVVELGTQDLSTRVLPRVPEAIPQHLPKFFTFAQKGSTEPQLVSGVELLNVFGEETFNERGIFATHTTPYIKGVNSLGNAMMVQRVIPADAGPKANMVVWLDVLPTTVDVYERNTDGSIKLDPLGDPIVVSTTPGYKVKWVVTHHATHTAAQNFGQLTIVPGDQTDPLTSVQSQRYPIFEQQVGSQGAAGNLSGIRLWAPTTKTVSAMPSKMMNVYKAFPYFYSVIKRADTLSSPKQVETLFGEQKIMVTLKPGVVDPMSGQQMYFGDKAVSAYQNLTDLRYPKVFGEFGSVHVYDSNIDTLVTLFHAAEVPFIDQNSDFTSNAADKHLFNFVTGVTSAGIAYNSYVFVDSANSVRFSDYTNVYAAGGTDGTMNNTVFDQLVRQEMANYLDANHPVQEKAINVESAFYDTGFGMDTKYSLCNAIAVRKDTYVVLGTHQVDGPVLTASEEHSIAIALRTRLQMFPESDYFGTPVMRGMIVGRSATVRNSLYTGRLPLTYEVAMGAATYMGAGDGRWKSGAQMDGAPGSVVKYMTDINITWVPVSVRNRNWDVGLNWVQAYDRSSYFFPALKTVYDNDTSVLNSFLTMVAICELNKIANETWRQFSGRSDLSPAQLVQKTNDYFTSRVANRFDGRFIVRPDAQVTDLDNLRGFSFTMPIKLFANNMRTVMTTYVQAFRMSDAG
jgi:hypothetical protein